VINKWQKPQSPTKDEDFYILNWQQFEFLPGVFDAFKLLDTGERHRVDYDYRIIVISNQSGIGEGLVDEDYETGYLIIDNLFQVMESKIQKESGVWIEYCFCPHALDAGCACRKPKPGMIYKYAVDYDLDLSQCWMIGDQVSDMEAGQAAGITNLIKIDSDADKEYVSCWYKTMKAETVITRFVRRSLLGAIELIIEQNKTR